MTDNLFATHFQYGDHASRPAAGDVPPNSLYACSDHIIVYVSDGSTWSNWHDPTGLTGGGTTLEGRPAQAFPNGFSMSGAVTALGLSALSGADAGALAVPIAVPAPMQLEGFGIWATDTATARSAEARLYLDDGDAVANFVTGTDAAFSFTPSAAALRRASVSGAPVSLDPGVYWLVIRNSHATSTFGLGRQSPGTILLLTMYRAKNIPALGATLDLDTSWTDGQNGPPAVWLEGRVVGRTAAL